MDVVEERSAQHPLQVTRVEAGHLVEQAADVFAERENDAALRIASRAAGHVDERRM
jgi:hypothetical protein